MTRLRMMRPLLLTAAVVVVVGSLLGARLLGPGGGGGTDSSVKSPAPPAAKDTIGTVVIGDADSDPPPARYGLPPVLQSGQVAEVFVKQGDTVKVGEKLYKFDSRPLERKLAEAEAAVGTARAKLAEAQGEADLHATYVVLAEQDVKAAQRSVELAFQARQVAEWNKKDSYSRQGIEAARWPELLKNDADLFKLYTDHAKTEIASELAKAKLGAVKSAQDKKLAKVVAVAEAVVKQAESNVEEAKSAVDMCTVTARRDGTVERVSVSPGDVMGISSVVPALVLIPSGPRVVRARVEAEFASKIGPNQIGRQVTIQDFTDPKVTWQGKVRGLGGSFLPRRANEGAIVTNETRSLEVVVEVLDAAPPGKPPLRVGQQVRVTFAP
ncbi:HlyD family secretion protein [Urbifossiella limnaea]|uniref:Multidrug resistance protein MdtN n=1 Tax=Urbifossiella limnaea TaxID=2528023 RepID=A0A517Y266_9BACT|nr:biotin/lipoyl-binding protein [Urbifossiella limnaea]QDU23829.1 Multidrug resistance protein MdtN [Urbifossiella limnaea]